MERSDSPEILYSHQAVQCLDIFGTCGNIYGREAREIAILKEEWLHEATPISRQSDMNEETLDVRDLAAFKEKSDMMFGGLDEFMSSSSFWNELMTMNCESLVRPP